MWFINIEKLQKHIWDTRIRKELELSVKSQRIPPVPHK